MKIYFIIPFFLYSILIQSMNEPTAKSSIDSSINERNKTKTAIIKCYLEAKEIIKERNKESQDPASGLKRVQKEPERLRTVFPVSSKQIVFPLNTKQNEK